MIGWKWLGRQGVILDLAMLFVVAGTLALIWFAEQSREARHASEQRLAVGDALNLARSRLEGHLQANIQLVLENPEKALHATETPVIVSRVRSDILELLTEQQAPALVTPEGKAALKAAIKERAAHALHETEVVDVLFSEFVVQF